MTTRPASRPASRHLEAFDLAGRVAIVTGASSGLGVQFANALDAAGASVVLAARRTDLLETVANDLHDARIVTTDVGQVGDLDALVASTLQHYGRIDILVNNAGAADHGPAVNQDDSDFARVVDLNLVAPYRLAKRVAPTMVGQGSGTIVNVASIMGLRPTGSIPQAGYAASKGGLINLTRELALQWAALGVRVNALAPGWFDSELTSDMLASERGQRWINRNTPMQRFGKSGELDGALLFLASDASSFVTGQVIVVDGGWTAQ
jgi:NAD(P)-dependent dehydrogenase (short-subunit alcohol dehydrogenase family)